MISAAMVKELRERTGAGMMDCKKALTETNGDMEAAIDFLREKGLSQAAKNLAALPLRALWLWAFRQMANRALLLK